MVKGKCTYKIGCNKSRVRSFPGKQMGLLNKANVDLEKS